MDSVSLMSTMKASATLTILLSGKVPANPFNLIEELKYFSAGQFLSDSLFSAPAMETGSEWKDSQTRREGVQQEQDPSLSLPGLNIITGLLWSPQWRGGDLQVCRH